MNHILIVDDEKNQRDILSVILRKDGFETLTAPSAEEALQLFGSNEIDVVITDLQLPKMDGLGLLSEILASSPDTSVILITGHGTINSAVAAIKRGAFDYITKPLRKEDVIAVTRKAFERANLLKERKYLLSRLNKLQDTEGIVGEHPLFQAVMKMILKIAPLDATVLITGDSGTGKEFVARAIHNISRRKPKPFIPVNCAALPENLIESELFGYIPGAFTGATTRKKGLFEAASEGTLFLDEISEMPLSTQVKMLRVIQNKEVLPLGSITPVQIDTRIIAATNKNLEDKVREGAFRADLYYRLNVFSLKIPSLRERSSDIPLLANYLLEKYKYLTGGKSKYFSGEALKLFLDYTWPGNIRELETVIQKAVVYSEHEEISRDDVAGLLTGAELFAEKQPETAGPQVSGEQSLDEIERDLIIKAMEKSDWKMSKACKLLGITYRTLQYRLGKYDIKKDTPNR